MTLALLVAFGTLICWVGILVLRWLRVMPSSPEIATRALFAAAGLSGAYIGGGYPLVWAMIRNLSAWVERGSTSFTFAGNLPPGVDEDDLLALLVIGMAILIGQASAEAWRALR
ncbi:MAG: hypothetical protein U0893_24170 [Chloroflexota bacterium]